MSRVCKLQRVKRVEHEEIQHWYFPQVINSLLQGICSLSHCVESRMWFSDSDGELGHEEEQRLFSG